MTTATAATATWNIDAAHSVVEFSVKHMMVSTVKGRFRDVAGTVEIDELNPANSTVAAEIDVASVDTGAPDRDNHLRSGDFFDAENFPKVTFRSTNVELTGAASAKMTGELMIRGVTRTVELDVEHEGRIIDAFGKDRLGFTATTKINRKDFNVNWNGLIEAGGVIVSDAVRITLNIAVVKQD
jgi:polyisoprenoid-binding protein YceI